MKIDDTIHNFQARMQSCLKSPQAQTLLRMLVAVVSVFVILLFIVTALRRLRYPYELEQLEGYVFLSALRVFHGQSVYPHPSLEFIPYMYPPGYYYVCAALGRVMGMSMATMRMASILSTLGCFAAIYGLVWSEVRRSMPAIAAAGLYAGCYAVCQEWFDLGRLDSFFVLLVLLSIYATRRLHPVIAAILWVLAFQTKQSILPVAIVMLCCNWREVRRTVSGLITLAIGVVGSVEWLNHATEGWYSFFVFAVPKANSDIKLRALAIFWSTDMLRPLALALMVIVAAVAFTRPSLQSQATRFYLAACSIVPIFWVIRAHAGSTVNALMPIYALVSVLFGIALARLLAWLPSIDRRLAQGGALLLLVAVIAQEAAGVYNPGDYLPTVEANKSLAALVAQLRGVSGEVYEADHPYYAWLAGKPTEADVVSIQDATHASAAVKEELRTELQTALTQRRFVALAFDNAEVEDKIDKIAAQKEDWQSCYQTEEATFTFEPDVPSKWMFARTLPGGAGCAPQPGTVY